MSNKKNVEDKISSLEEKIKQLNEQKKQLLSQQKSKERKERTRRLIQIGAIFTSMGIDTEYKAKNFKDTFQNDKDILNWFASLDGDLDNKNSTTIITTPINSKPTA